MSNVTLKSVWSKDSSGIAGGGVINIIEAHQDENGEHVTCAGTFIYEQDDKSDIEFDARLEATKDNDGIEYSDIAHNLELSNEDEDKVFDFLKAEIKAYYEKN